MLTDKIVMVTGASQGIGLATARAFAKAGAKTLLVARSAEKLKAAAAEVGGEAHPCDVTDPEAVAALFDAVKAAHGRLDVLFNNAGASLPSTDFGDLAWADWRKLAEVNLDGAFLAAHGAYRLMRAQDPRGGRIINNGSISAYVPRPGSAPYTATKHAITGLTRSISLDGRKHDIACCQIDIGNAASDMTAAMNAGVPQADGTIKPEPTMDVRHVADTVVHMASLPLEANMQFVNVMATKMPFIGRG